MEEIGAGTVAADRTEAIFLLQRNIWRYTVTNYCRVFRA